MSTEIQVMIEEQNVSKSISEEMAKAFGAPFTEAGKILNDYQYDEKGELIVTDKTIVVTDEDAVELMATAKKNRLVLKKARNTIENNRKALKDESLRTGRAIDAVANFIKGTIEPVEKYLELQEKYAETQENIRRSKIKAERIERLRAVTDDVHHYNLDTMNDLDFDKLLKELTEAKELRLAHEQAYEEQQAKLREEKELEDQRIREENETLKKQADVREAEIAEERAQQEIVHEAELKQTVLEVSSKVAKEMKQLVHALNRYEVPGVNEGRPMVNLESVIELINAKL